MKCRLRYDVWVMSHSFVKSCVSSSIVVDPAASPLLDSISYSSSSSSSRDLVSILFNCVYSSRFMTSCRNNSSNRKIVSMFVFSRPHEFHKQVVESVCLSINGSRKKLYIWIYINGFIGVTDFFSFSIPITISNNIAFCSWG